jgi:hypothetical protein
MRKDDVTLELPGVVKRRGRPSTGKAMTPAERKAASRARLAAEGKGVLSVDVSLEVIEALRKHVQFKDEDQGEAVDRILRAYLLRKR